MQEQALEQAQGHIILHSHGGGTQEESRDLTFFLNIHGESEQSERRAKLVIQCKRKYILQQQQQRRDLLTAGQPKGSTAINTGAHPGAVHERRVGVAVGPTTSSAIRVRAARSI